MTDYWLSKMFFDLQAPPMLARWKEDREAVLAEYPLAPEARQAVIDGDLGALSLRVNAYLLRFYCTVTGMSDAELLKQLHALKGDARPEPAKEEA